MIKLSSLVFSLLLVANTLWANTGEIASKADHFFKIHVSNGLVNYKAIVDQPQNLNALVEMIATVDLSNANADEQLAFYLNAYNILVIKSVIDHYPLASPLDVEGFFKVNKHTIANQDITLDEIESSIIRPTYQDARIHFALVCGAKGCPPLTKVAFTSDNVNARLEELTRTALNDDSFIRTEAKLQISEIFKWYRSDFGNTDAEVIHFLNKYRNTAIDKNAEIAYYSYDWQLNMP